MVAIGISCTSSCKRPDSSSSAGVTAGLRCQFCLQKHLLTLASNAQASAYSGNTKQASTVDKAGPKGMLPGRDLSLPRFQSCAVVGYGRHLDSSGCGREIEAHEAIFRTSCHPAKGDAPEDVGNRTDFDIWNGFARKAFLRGDPDCIETLQDPKVGNCQGKLVLPWP